MRLPGFKALSPGGDAWRFAFDVCHHRRPASSSFLLVKRRYTLPGIIYFQGCHHLLPSSLNNFAINR
jgi:hypothetical protein